MLRDNHIKVPDLEDRETHHNGHDGNSTAAAMEQLSRNHIDMIKPESIAILTHVEIGKATKAERMKG